MCGKIADYSADPAQRHGPRNPVELVEQRATARGFLVTGHADRFDEITSQLAARVADGRVRHTQVSPEGLEHAPVALDRIFRGDNLGKVIVRVAPHQEFPGVARRWAVLGPVTMAGPGTRGRSARRTMSQRL
ncbi:hypothetical protein ACWD04_11915 [Streptomyces sp. NPDC002911]